LLISFTLLDNRTISKPLINRINMTQVFLHAPGVHTGGGKVLLQAILAAPPLLPITAYLDQRSLGSLNVPASVSTVPVNPSPLGRLTAEIQLRRSVDEGSRVLCFHGLPPLFRLPARTVVFLQNRLNIEENAPTGGGAGSRYCVGLLRRSLCRRLRFHADEFVVQTASMKEAVLRWYGDGAPMVHVIPFLDDFTTTRSRIPTKQYDFIYVADGVSHKNHRNLIAAWILLAQEGYRPSLVLTLGKRDANLWQELDKLRIGHTLNILNVGDVGREQIFELYRQARALIYPSLSESFGIPLIEATRFAMPIVASERDFVRDVCAPEQTFDPCSPQSIARAVKRHLGLADPPCVPVGAREFWAELLQ
jgi:glycosyltransferase involved in cell wall biosynthesis